MTGVFLGFDPGGEQQFGWAVVANAPVPPLTIRASGLASNAAEAVSHALAIAGTQLPILGAGIDSPLFWRYDGDREADLQVRAAIMAKGAPSPTVQHVNSLRGACLVQGALTASLLRARLPSLPLTESHPKALLWLLDLLSHSNRAISHEQQLARWLVGSPTPPTEHQKDAALGGLTAWAMHHKARGWVDLFPAEPPSLIPFPGPVAYWMPLSRATRAG